MARLLGRQFSANYAAFDSSLQKFNLLHTPVSRFGLLTLGSNGVARRTVETGQVLQDEILANNYPSCGLCGHSAMHHPTGKGTSCTGRTNHKKCKCPLTVSEVKLGTMPF